MKCAKCGAELKKGCLYCSVCGHEAQIVSDYNVLEDDYLRSLLKDGESAKNPQKTEVEPQKNKKKKNNHVNAQRNDKQFKRVYCNYCIPAEKQIYSKCCKIGKQCNSGKTHMKF